MSRAMRLATVVVAALIVVGFLILHALGARAEVGLLSGTLPAGDEAVAVGVLYIAAWFGFVLVAPILVLTLALDLVVEVVLGRAECGSIAARVRGWLGFHRR
jgi:hypothetical protein